jgi:3-hydroxyacyl-CoA dehydrogenase
MRPLRKIVILGANGAMGAGAGAIFASAGIPTTMLARTLEKAEAGRAKAEHMAKGKVAPKAIAVGTYDHDLATAAGDADLIFECVCEDLETKRQVFAQVDRVRAPGSVVATVSSGLSIAAMCAGQSDDFRAHFLGIHLFNPPTIIRGCELIPHAGTDPQVTAAVGQLLETTLDRVVVPCADTPAFAGNRIGFKLLNEIAQLAEEHGVAYMDQLVGAHTGRALAPLATIDLVGWDVHKAIVDNLWATTHDECHEHFRLPAYMQRMIDRGHLGRKTRDKGGFFRVEGKGADAVTFVLDPASGNYGRLVDVQAPIPTFIERMKQALRDGNHAEAFDVLCTTDGRDATLLRRIMLGYISYALGRVGEVVEHARDVDRIMGFGFNWAPPSVLVDAIGAARTIALLEREGLLVPPVVAEAAVAGKRLYDEPHEPARFFTIAA